MITAEQLDRAIADDDAIGFEHDGDLRRWLSEAGVAPTAAGVAGAFVIRNGPNTIAAGRTTQLDVTRVVLAGVRWGLRIAGRSSRRAISDDRLEAALTAARDGIDRAGGDVYAWLEAAGFERDVAAVALAYVVRATEKDGLAGQSHLPAWWVRPETSLMLIAGLIAGLQLGHGAESR